MGRKPSISFGKKPASPLRCYIKLEEYPAGGGTRKPSKTRHITVYSQHLDRVEEVIKDALQEAFGNPQT
jgi:hypothetical protein